ncbi:MAG: hypothetical protein JNM56_18905 [Planctomycetia bacterium]|nr:hypothetical protein [Planctomycetia bacterium]
MITLTTDDTRLLKDLQQYAEPVGVFDPSGELLGMYLPVNQHVPAKPQFDPEEIKRRLATEKPVGNFTVLVQRLKLLENERQRRRAEGVKEITFEEARAFLRADPGQLPGTVGD